MLDTNLRNPWIEIGKRWKLYGSPGRPSQSETMIRTLQRGLEHAYQK